ncbi:Ig-like domain-containing protein, partial [Thermobrachium celere]
MKFTKTTIDVRSGQTYDLKQILNIYPLGIDTPELNWESSNTKILTVTNEGIVIPVTTGVAYVKVSSKANPKIAAYIKVQVPVEVQS